MRSKLWLISLVLVCVGCASSEVTSESIEKASATVDYGDSSSQTLLSKAWPALEKKKFPELFAYTRRCVEYYGEEGKWMNSQLTRFEPEPVAHKQWALNDVGTCLFIMAEAYVQLEQYSDATRTYRILAEDFTYAQTWDPKGWFWRPADGAARKAEKYKNW